MTKVYFTQFGKDLGKVIGAVRLDNNGFARMVDHSIIEVDRNGKFFAILPDKEYFEISVMMIEMANEGYQFEPNLKELDVGTKQRESFAKEIKKDEEV